WVFGKAGRNRLGYRAHRTRVGRFDEATWLHEVRRARRRRRLGRYNVNGRTGTTGAARHAYQPTGGGSTGDCKVAPLRRTGPRRAFRRREARVRATAVTLWEAVRVCCLHAYAATDALRTGGFARGTGGVAIGPRRRKRTAGGGSCVGGSRTD